MGVILTPLIFSIIISYFLFPLVNYLEKQKISRSAAIITIYVFFAVLFLTLCLHFLPLLLKEIKELVATVPEYAERFEHFIKKMEADYKRFQLPEPVRAALDENIARFKSAFIINIEKLSEYIMFFLEQVFILLLVPLFTFYFLRDEVLFKRNLLKFVPQKYRFRVEKALQDINNTLGSYLRGVFIISLTVGAMVYLGLLLLEVEFALFLGIVNGISNIIPYFGPLIGAVPVILIALLQSFDLAWKSALVLFIAQQIEGLFIAPQVFSRKLEFHPMSVIIALLLGGKLFGFLGLVLIIPAIAVFRIIIIHFFPIIREIITKQT